MSWDCGRTIDFSGRIVYSKFMKTKVRDYMKKYHMTEPGDLVIAGVSGGADSVCLLLMLAQMRRELNIRLEVVHVNHGLRSEADEEEEWVRRLCGSLEVAFTAERVDVAALAQQERISCEEAGRKARYQAFEERAKHCLAEEDRPEGRVRIAVAHHRNDRAETVLFHLLRGTGLTGMTGIRAVRDQVIRPLLCVSREEIEAYLKERGIGWCMDASNAEDTYTRNKIRLHLLPYAEREICRGSMEHIVKMSETVEETEDFLESYCEGVWKECLMDMDSYEKLEEGAVFVLCIKKLLSEHPAIQKRLLLYGLRQMKDAGRDIGSAHLESALGLLKTQGSRELCLPHGVLLKKEYGRLLLCRNVQDKRRVNTAAKGDKDDFDKAEGEQDRIVPIPGKIELEDGRILHFQCIPYEKSQNIPEKSYTKWFDYDKIKKSVVVRNRRTGDYLTVDSSLSRQTLKKYMIQEKIPKERRGRQYVLAEGAHILWVIGYRISQYYKVDEHTKNILEVQLEERKEEHG